MATSAKCTYSAVAVGGVFNYEVRLQNTSPAPYDIYSWMLGAQFNVPFPTSGLKDIVFISAPAGWIGHTIGHYINWHTSFQGSSLASGYILAGQSKSFFFQSSTPPPPTLVFGCCFYNNASAWGFVFNGVAKRQAARSPYLKVPVPASYNPWWWIETYGGLVPPGPHDPWYRPELRARSLERTLEQLSIISTAIKTELKAAKGKRKRK